jgi:hypothetical protein
VKQFRVPHHHLILEDRYGYDVWTYAGPSLRMPLETLARRRATAVLDHGDHYIFVTCGFPRCEIYVPDSRGRLSVEDIHGRIDSFRDSATSLQGH